jgi:cell division protein FtsQ
MKGGVYRFTAIFCVILITMVFLGFVANRWRHTFGVEQIDVEGNRIVSSSEIRRLASVPDSASLYDLDLRLMRERILQQPFIKEVFIRRETSAGLKIKVSERTPVAMLNNTNLVYLDEEGYVLPNTFSKKVFDLPVISGIAPPIDASPGQKIESADIKIAMEIISVAKEINEELYHLISEINLNNGKDILIYSTEWGVPIIFGRGEAQRKLTYLNAFLKQYEVDRGIDNITYIDVRFDRRVVVRWAAAGETKEASILLSYGNGVERR